MRPHYLNPFFMFHRNQTIVFTFTNLHTAVNEIYLTFQTIRLPKGWRLPARQRAAGPPSRGRRRG